VTHTLLSNYYDDNPDLERRELPPDTRYMVAPGCRRCGGSGLLECEQQGHDFAPTLADLERRIVQLEQRR